MRELTPMEGPTLQVQVEGTARDGMRLYEIAVPVNGRVQVREWRGESWADGPVDRTCDAGALFAELEQAYHDRRRLSEELYRIRLWLEGTGR